MASNEDPEIFLRRADRKKKETDNYWARYKEAEAKGNIEEAKEFKKEASKCYNAEKSYRKQAEENKGKN